LDDFHYLDEQFSPDSEEVVTITAKASLPVDRTTAFCPVWIADSSTKDSPHFFVAERPNNNAWAAC
jgi:hypothetical protein